ncbi:protein SET DOMAIN GROUP 40 isoform X1 [Ziziphus jujuba]|uniref:Protein SET DOMAIN GROUP 40 isoform X1 n=1 Tax=Ziziphus jujuba TaxID=326968 RepID=A0A6P4A0I6_ZIZJJ|nr:protein SET DOMAIN GROUP 40 isoform X1 [Ziziphus jujuba]
MEQEEDNLESLLKWAAEIGVSDSAATSQHGSSNSCLGHSLFVSYFPHAGGRGLGAARDIRKGELVLRVPKSALLTREILLEDEKLSVAVNGHSSLSPVQILAVCLLYEMQKGRSSWWYPYLRNLPHNYDILATFGEFEKQALQVDDAVWAAEKAILKAEVEWKEANVLMKELNLKGRLQTFRAWIWASATISSRTMHIPWDEAGCLCPVGDLFNYAAPGEEPSGFEDLELQSHTSSFQDTTSLCGDTTYMLDVEQLDACTERLTDGCFVEDVAAYCFYARENYKRDEQVLLCYGTYTNLELLEHYGFFLYENPNDKVFIPLEPEIYSSNSWPKESMFIHQSGKPSFALLSALRLWATQPSQRRSVAHLAYSGCQLSVENEILVMRWISNKCNVLLKSLPTSFEEDSLLLDSIGKVQGLHNSLELRTYLASFTGEISAFVEVNGLRNVEDDSALPLSRKIKRSMERWRLAVQWRLNYKKILVNCISYCAESIDSFNCQKIISGTEHTLI